MRASNEKVLATGKANAVCLTGCPDYSHLRTAPDYSSQKDPDEGDKGTATNTSGVPVPTTPGVSDEGPLDESGRPIE